MSFKILADAFSVARDSDHFIQLKTLKNPRITDEVWIAFGVEGDTKFARATLQNITDSIDEVFFDNVEADSYERFEATLKEINLIYKNSQKKGGRPLGRVSSIIAVFSGESLFIAQCGDAEAYLIRGNRLSLVSEGLSGRSEDLFVNIASGELMSEDKLLFSTSRLLRLATHSQLAQICKDGVTESVDSIRELVLGDTELSIGVSCLHAKLPHRATSKAPTRENLVVFRLKKWWNMGADFIETKMNGRRVNMSRNNILAILLGIVLILILSVSFLMESNRNRMLREEYKTRIEAMNQDLRTASTKGYANDKATANAILDKVDTEAREILETNYFRSEALALLEKIQQTKDSINNTVRVNSTPYVDLAAKFPQIEALGLVNLDDKFFAYEYNNLYEVILDQVLEPKKIDNTEVVTTAAPMEDQNIIAFLTKSGRIMEYDNGTFRFSNTADENWKPAVDIAAYGRNLYLLSPSENQIYKYPRLRSSYANASEYNIDADLDGAISMAIDGGVYVLKKGGEIIRIFKGKRESFSIEDMVSDISDATKIYTSTELKNLYILDPIGKRIMVVEKEVGPGGRYKQQVYFNDLEGIQSFYVERDEKTVYLLTKKAIYQVAL